MQKYLELLIELLRPWDDDFTIQEKKNLLAAGEKIEKKWKRNLEIFHRFWFLFKAYEELLQEKIWLDEFLAIGDITSTKKLTPNDQPSINIVNSIINWTSEIPNNSLVILDSISFWVLSTNDKEKIQIRAKDHNCELIFC